MHSVILRNCVAPLFDVLDSSVQFAWGYWGGGERGYKCKYDDDGNSYTGIFVYIFCLISMKLSWSNQSVEKKGLDIESVLHNELSLKFGRHTPDNL